MNYTIAVLDNPFGNLKLDICVSGNKNNVLILAPEFSSGAFLMEIFTGCCNRLE